MPSSAGSRGDTEFESMCEAVASEMREEHRVSAEDCCSPDVGPITGSVQCSEAHGNHRFSTLSVVRSQGTPWMRANRSDPDL
jgi:hypothetical protein